jgi:hypothetical protein
LPEEIIRQYLFDRPGLYLIRVVGELGEHWLAHLECLEISTISWGNYNRVTQINGWLADQTALYGLLDLLNDLGRVILTVERLEDESSCDSSIERQLG